MKALAVVLAVVGFIVTVTGAVRIYRGRMREDPDHPGLYIPPKSDPGDLILAIGGAMVALAGGVVGAVAD